MDILLSNICQRECCGKQTGRHSLELLQLPAGVKGQRNLRSASKNNCMFPPMCEDLALRVRKPGQGRKEHKWKHKTDENQVNVEAFLSSVRHCCGVIVNAFQCLVQCEYLRVNRGVCAIKECLARTGRFCLPGTFDNVWRHFWLARLGEYCRHLIGRGQGYYNAQNRLPENNGVQNVNTAHWETLG